MEVLTEKCFQCGICDANFSLKSAIYRHYNDAHSSHSTDNRYACGNCPKAFGNMISLRRHLKRQHFQQSFKPNQLPVSNIFICNTCKATFSMKYSLERHIKKNHVRLPLPDFTCAKRALLCCCNCQFSCGKFDALLSHYAADHEIEIKTEEFTFDNFNSFLMWKDEEEKQSYNKYIKHRTTRINANGCENIVYYCHRSGCYKSQSKGKRNAKTQGSKKIGKDCPARMFVKILTDGRALVRYINCHIGHDPDLCHLSLSTSERKSLADKIAMRIPFEDILDEVRNSVTSEKTRLDRLDLITRRDLNNIERSFKLTAQRGVRHENDAISVDSWARESEAVLFYKPQGTVAESIPELHCDDFCLIIMDDSQKLVMEKFGKDCICLDTLCGVSLYGFELTTLLVLDELQQGFPCAFMISNKTDKIFLSLFFSCIKSQVAIRQTKAFMSDTANSSYNAWEMEMGPADYRLFSAWHVDNDWRNNLKKISCRFEKKKDVYQKLTMCMHEIDENSFSVMFSNVLHEMKLDSELIAFADYFESNYVENVKCWAYCYRIHCGLNTNMHFERMHRTIKFIYLKAKKNKRVDTCIYSLMSFTRDKVFDRLISLNKESVSSKINVSQKRHVESLKISPDDIFYSETDNKWIIKSTRSNNFYDIFIGNENCKCCFECSDCNICIHKYLCTCVDSSIRWNICKHVHALARYINTELSKSATANDIEIVIHGNIVDTEEFLETMPEACPSTSSNISPQSFQEAKQTLLEDIEHLVSNNVNTLEDLLLVRKMLQPILPSLKAAKSKRTTVQCVAPTIKEEQIEG